MTIIYVLIPIAVIFIFIAIGIFIWAVKSEQFDDIERHGSSVLFDDQESAPRPSHSDRKEK